MVVIPARCLVFLVLVITPGLTGTSGTQREAGGGGAVISSAHLSPCQIWVQPQLGDDAHGGDDWHFLPAWYLGPLTHRYPESLPDCTGTSTSLS